MRQGIIYLPPNRVRRNYKGGAYLDGLEGSVSPKDSDKPEDWIASTVTAKNPGMEPVENEGLSHVELDGKEYLLKDLFEQDPTYYLGNDHYEKLGPELGFLTKLLDSSMRLHIQAHPTADFASKYLNSKYGKLETYYVIGIRPDSPGNIFLGFQHPPSLDEWKRIVKEQDIDAMHACFEPVPINPGEVWLVPGGLPHAIGEGVLVLEVQEPTDLVVRCEFEREGVVVPPEARFMGEDPDFALNIFDMTPLPVEGARKKWLIQPKKVKNHNGVEENILIGGDQTSCFTTRMVEIHKSSNSEKLDADKIYVGITAEGKGRVSAGGSSLEVRAGTCFLVPAGVNEISYDVPTDKEHLKIIYCTPCT